MIFFEIPSICVSEPNVIDLLSEIWETDREMAKATRAMIREFDGELVDIISPTKTPLESVKQSPQVESP